MKRSELSNICDKIVQLHLNDLKSELPELVKKSMQNPENLIQGLATLMSAVQANSVIHSVQAVTDVLVNVGLLELEND